MTKKKLTYEQASEELQDILEKLQEDEVGLDSLANYLIRAKELIEFCRNKLRAVEDELEGIFDEDE